MLDTLIQGVAGDLSLSHNPLEQIPYADIVLQTHTYIDCTLSSLCSHFVACCMSHFFVFLMTLTCVLMVAIVIANNIKFSCMRKIFNSYFMQFLPNIGNIG